MERNNKLRFDPYKAPSPSFVLDEKLLENNLNKFEYIQSKTRAKILLALKGFAMYSVFPRIKKILYGVCASTPHEAQLGRKRFKKEVHTFQAAYSESDLKTDLKLSDHIVFNSFSQWEKFKTLTEKYSKKVSFGIRVNPEHSEAPAAIYDPCCRFSRLGVKKDSFKDRDLTGISGLHFHTLCEQDSFALERTLIAFEKNFSEIIPRMKWINFGGGHHITREDYDIGHLINLINNFQDKYNTDIYLEPGEAVALNTGFFISTVLDIIENEMKIAVLDCSAAAHLPDVIEMPYRPDIIDSGKPEEHQYTYKLGGMSCLAGDIIGDYSFKKPLKPGDRLVFTDMAHYTIVKTNTFNGIKLPDICIVKKEKNDIKVIRRFGYKDFETRLS